MSIENQFRTWQRLALINIVLWAAMVLLWSLLLFLKVMQRGCLAQPAPAGPPAAGQAAR